MNRCIDRETFERIKAIHHLSQAYNQKVGVNHAERLMDLIKKHAIEIEALLKQKNPHAFIETGDLLILCFELLLEHGQPLEEIIVKCMARYERKLKELDGDVQPEGSTKN